MSITLKDFTSVTDLEQSRYYLLGKMKISQQNFNETKVFPEFQDLITLYETITNILANRYDIFLKEYTDKLNPEKDKEKQLQINDEIEMQFKLMEWALPFLQELLEQGRNIYDFVDQNINIESIGLKSEYNQEGYMIIPDNKLKVFRIIRYNKTLHQMLKTREVDNYAWNVIIIPREHLKNYLLSNDILNQIIYLLDTELSFPYKETISPIARRKFLKFLEREQ